MRVGGITMITTPIGSIKICTDEVAFGVAWATDYEGPFDCRTWYAADPTLDGERSST